MFVHKSFGMSIMAKVSGVVVGMVLRIFNLEGHQHCVSGTCLLWIMRELAGEGLWLLALVTGGR